MTPDEVSAVGVASWGVPIIEVTMLRDSPLSSSNGSVGVIWTKPPLKNSELNNLEQEISEGSKSMLLYKV
jgi:hypothetical protein